MAKDGRRVHGAASEGVAVGYVRVSTAEQGDSRAGLEAQRQAITDACAARGWRLLVVHEDVASGKAINGRPGLHAALNAIQRGEADRLVAAKVDRISRSLLDFSALLTRAQRQGWRLVALDLGIDLDTPMGEAMASMAATFSQLERRLIGQRTRDALAVKRAQGVRLGRPRVLPDDVVARIVREREAGRTLQAIAEGLDADGVPRAQGGARWYPRTVLAVLQSAA
jgi:DNA invertase Pin-like site-specific DNA recombinase